MPPLSFTEARETVLREVRAALPVRKTENVELSSSQGRVLAEDIAADRDYPPFNRSMRDGFAVRAAELPGEPRVIGEVRAGSFFAGAIHPGEALEIMTGAPVPEGADAVVMVEHGFNVTVAAGANISTRGCEAAMGTVVLARGARIDYTGIGWLATTGHPTVRVFTRPTVAILATGDEIVPVSDQPAAHQIRNSNAFTLAAQVERAGGVPVVMPVAHDRLDHTRALIEQGLACDLLLLSGGVSAGKYDVVEPALTELGAEFFFDRVRIQPGQPLVFGKARGKFFFGLPGNPASTMVTFEVFARAALRLLGGEQDADLPFAFARLTESFRHKPGLTRFLPAELREGAVTPVRWQGSGDVPSLCRANCYLVAQPDQAEYAAGAIIPVLSK